MKKSVLFLLTIFICSNIFAQTKSLSNLSEDNFSWRILEKAERAFDEKNFAQSANLVQSAKINRKNECKIYVDILEQALSPLPVQNVGDKIDPVIEILTERNSKDALKIINDIVRKKGKSYFSNSVQKILEYYKSYEIYPEADFLQAKIYRLEGELELSQELLLFAWENSDKLDIPMMKYDILYELASLYKIQDNNDDYEKTLLLIVSEDENYYQDGIPSTFLTSVVRNLKSGISIDKLFLLYRCDSYNQINAYFQLTEIYMEQKNNEKMLETSVLGMISSVTAIEEILSEQELNYSYKNFKHFCNYILKNSEIVEWGIENNVWEFFYTFAQVLEMNDLTDTAKEMYNINVIYSPEEYWQKQSRERIKILENN